MYFNLAVACFGAPFYVLRPPSVVLRPPSRVFFSPSRFSVLRQVFRRDRQVFFYRRRVFWCAVLCFGVAVESGLCVVDFSVGRGGNGYNLRHFTGASR